MMPYDAYDTVKQKWIEEQTSLAGSHMFPLAFKLKLKQYQWKKLYETICPVGSASH